MHPTVAAALREIRRVLRRRGRIPVRQLGRAVGPPAGGSSRGTRGRHTCDGQAAFGPRQGMHRRHRGVGERHCVNCRLGGNWSVNRRRT